MSIKIMNMVWEHAPVSGNELILLLSMADFSDDTGGNIYPAHSTLAKKCRISVSSVKRLIIKLKTRGLIDKSQPIGHKLACSYTILVDNLVDNSVNNSNQGVQNELPNKSKGSKMSYPPGCSSELSGGSQLQSTIHHRSTIDPSVNSEDKTFTLSGDIADSKIEQRKTAISLIEYLNEQTGKNYPCNDTNILLVIARLKEGYPEETISKVIAKKCQDWGEDKKQCEYLRPKTLFGKTNMANYAGQV